MNIVRPRPDARTVRLPAIANDSLFLASLALVAAGLRLYRLGAESLWFDEIGQAVIARAPWFRVLLNAVQHRGNAPLDYLVTHWTYYYIGQSAEALRLPAVLWGTLTVCLLYLFGRDLFGRLAGATAATLLAITPIHIYYSQELRFYSLATFLTLATAYAFHRAVSNRSSWRLFTVTGALSFYAHYYTAVALAALGLWVLLFRRDVLRPFVLAAVAAGLAFLPWAFYDYQIVGGGTFNPWPAPLNLPPLPSLLASLFVVPTIRTCGVMCSLGALGVLSLVPLSVAALRQSEGDTRAGLALPLIVPLVGLPAVPVLDLIGRYPFAPRQTILFLPFLWLLVAGLFSRLRRDLVAPASAVLVIVCAALFIPVNVQLAHTHQKQDFRGLGRYLLQHVEPNDLILTSWPEFVTWYAPELRGQTYDTTPISSKGITSKAEDLAARHDRLWIVSIYDSDARRHAPLVDAGAQPVDVRGFDVMVLTSRSE